MFEKYIAAGIALGVVGIVCFSTRIPPHPTKQERLNAIALECIALKVICTIEEPK